MCSSTGSCHFFTVNNASLKKVMVERSKESGQVLVIVNSLDFSAFVIMLTFMVLYLS